MNFFSLIRCVLLLLLAAIVQLPPEAHAESVSDEAIFQQYLEKMTPKKNIPTGDMLVETARFFLGRPYVANTLESEPERLVINLRAFDCVTFVDTVMALTLTLRGTAPSFDTFSKNVQAIRYRDGIIGDYNDRLHYMSDWIFENQRAGRVKNITQEAGGLPRTLQLSFLSTRPEVYKALQRQPQRIKVMAQREKIISARQHYYIPQSAINQHAAQLKNGDIVCFATAREGMDVSHVGLVYHVGEKLTFIHASFRLKRVVIEELSLQEYAESIPQNIGIIVARPQF